MKKIIALLLSLSLILSLCACGQKAQEQETVVEMEEITEESVMNGAPDGDPTWMLDALEENVGQWLKEDLEDTYSTYAVTDWDHNGLLEITVSTYYSQQMAYGLAVYEVTDHHQPLQEITVGEDVVYAEYSSLNCYYTEPDQYYYVLGVQDSSGGDAYVERVYALYKEGNEMHAHWLGVTEGLYNEETEQYDMSFTDRDGNLVEGDLAGEVFPEMLGTEKRSYAILYPARLEWFEENIQSMLSDSYSGWYQEQADGIWFELEMYTDPDHFSWNEVENPEFIESDLPASSLDMPFRIVPSEDVTVTLMVGEWSFLPLTFRGQRAFRKDLKAGQAYEFMAPVGETLPLARLHATSGPNTDIFYDFAMDGSGEAPVMFRLQPSYPEFPTRYDTFMELCIAYAGIAAKYQDHYGITPEHIWDALANGITRYAMVWSDPDSEGNIYLDNEGMDQFMQMMCLYMYAPDPESNVSWENGQYIVKATFDEYLEGAYVQEVMMAGNGSCGKAIVVLPSMGNMDVEVNFEIAHDWQDHIDNPWVITGAVYGYG